MSSECGKLYVVATPIGNLTDMTFRAVDTLRQVDLIAAEDTRHIQLLLQHYSISNKVISAHQHNEERITRDLIAKLQTGLSIALVSDAGTPLINDPGMPLVKAVKEAGIDVIPIPGPCALITALSAAGLPTAKFSFEGFAPRTSSARKTFFTEKRDDTETWVFYESSHRILESIRDMAEVLPGDREIVIARELTKLHETIVKGNLQTLLDLVEYEPNMQKGEFVVIVAGAEPEKIQALSAEQQRILSILLKECSVKTAAALAEEITGARKKLLYQAALALTQS